MKTTQASRALTLLGVSLIAGAAVASEPARLDPTTVRTLAEAKRCKRGLKAALPRRPSVSSI